jgi:PilZ domain
MLLGKSKGDLYSPSIMPSPAASFREIGCKREEQMHERRITPRFALQIPVLLVLPKLGIQAEGKTRDIGSGGLFFYIDAPLNEHEEVQLLLNLPGEFTVGIIRVTCHARIIRLEQDVFGGKQGVAVAIQKFDFLAKDEDSAEIVKPF